MLFLRHGMRQTSESKSESGCGEKEGSCTHCKLLNSVVIRKSDRSARHLFIGAFVFTDTRSFYITKPVWIGIHGVWIRGAIIRVLVQVSTIPPPELN